MRIDKHPKVSASFPIPPTLMHFLRFFRTSQQHGKTQSTTTSDLFLPGFSTMQPLSLKCHAKQRFIQQQKPFVISLCSQRTQEYVRLTHVHRNQFLCVHNNLLVVELTFIAPLSSIKSHTSYEWQICLSQYTLYKFKIQIFNVICTKSFCRSIFVASLCSGERRIIFLSTHYACTMLHKDKRFLRISKYTCHLEYT